MTIKQRLGAAPIDALDLRSRYKLALQSALAVMGFDSVQIDELTRLAYDCQFEELNRRMTEQLTARDALIETYEPAVSNSGARLHLNNTPLFVRKVSA